MDALTPRQAAAKRLIRHIARNNGHLSSEFYDKMEPDARREVQEVLAINRRMIGASVILLARELYSLDVRFIFELLQNADDNHYQRLAGDAVPQVAFSLFNDRLVVDCNEDGFDERNLHAICSIGQSSKIADESHGYTGEKGIGFKSVFKVAWKVHIQSGDYSFTFTHLPGDDGMGMVNPEWEDATEQLDHCTTRITLYFLDDDEAASRHRDIENQLKGLESAMLLFLRRLRRISVHIYKEQNQQEYEESQLTITASLDESTHMATLRTSRREGDGATKELVTLYHVTKHLVTGLAKSKQKTYSKATEASKSYSTAEIILAFPTTDQLTPLIEAQKVYAFLPMRPVGFNFLIQADFVTTVNRESVVEDSPRNLGMVGGIADAFIKAVHEMQDQPALRYTWMRYLSKLKTYSWENFWKKVVDHIDSKLRAAAILMPRRGNSLRLTSELRLLKDDDLDEHGEPLFPDFVGKSEKYISTCYSVPDLKILTDYGLIWMDQMTWLEYVRHDLGLPKDESRLKGPNMTDSWHTRTASRLNLTFRHQTWELADKATRELAIIPLNSGDWVNSMATPIFFPRTDSSVAIPEHLDVHILDAKSYKNKERVKLYVNLGVTHASADVIRSAIFSVYDRRGLNLDFSVSYSYLTFLYQTHRSESLETYKKVLIDTGPFIVAPCIEDIYLPSDDPSSLWQLSRCGEDEWFEENVDFANPEYLSAPHPSSKTTELSWMEWLLWLKLRDRPRLVTTDQTSLSPLCLHIAQEQPSKFLHFIKYSWPTEGVSLMASKEVMKAMANIKVPCLGSHELRPLSDTFLPLANLQETCNDLMGDVFFPFIDVGEANLTGEEAASWDFLRKHFAVQGEDDIIFYISMLYWLREGSDGEEVTDAAQVVKIYERLHSRCLEAKDGTASRKLLQERFSSYRLIYIPRLGDEEGRWTSLDDCLLDAPVDLDHKYPIVARYERALPDDDLGTFKHFFSKTVAIPQFTWNDMVNELEHMKEEEIYAPEKVLTYYQLLESERLKWSAGDIRIGQLKTFFQEKSLLFVPESDGEGEWLEPSECLWSTATEIPHKAMLNHHYDDDMEAFFVTTIGVSRLTIDMVYDQLVEVKPSTHSVEQVKEWWRILNSLFEAESPRGAPDKLMNKPIFPIRYPDGSVVLCSAETEFAIIDRRPLELKFRDKIKLLDFSLNEVHQLEPLLVWMNLRARYLSRLVREHTAVDAESLYPLSDSSREISRRAHALTRIAVHLESTYTRNPDATQQFFDRLRGSETWETDGIRSVLTIRQDNATAEVDLERSEVHIGDGNSQLKIYVPHDEVSQEVCFASALPGELVRWMMGVPTIQQLDGQSNNAMIKTVTSILGIKSSAGINRVLEAHGIVDIEIPEPAEEEIHPVAEDAATTAFGALAHRPKAIAVTTEQESSPDSHQVTEVTAATSFGALAHRPKVVPVSVGGSPLRPDTPGTDIRLPLRTARFDADTVVISRHGTTDELDEIGDDDHDPDLIEQIPLHGFTREPSTPIRRSHYSTLLEHIIRAARSSEIPVLGRTSSSIVAGQSALDLPPEDQGYPGAWLDRECVTSFERDCKVGAAGELFAFELLKSALDDVDYTCWQSTMRRLVTGPQGHADYADMGPWNSAGQRETSDIVYHDASGQLVSLLVEKGYLDTETWAGRQGVQCYVEVKSTFEQCDAPFFLSDRQYNMMSELMTDTSIYMIARVFGLSNGSIGAKLYVDPDRLRQEGRLRFSTKKWTVKSAY